MTLAQVVRKRGFSALLLCFHTLTKVLVLQGIKETVVSASQPERRIVTAIAAAELAHTVGGHLAWLARYLRGLSPETRDDLAKGYEALLAMFRRPPGPQQIAVSGLGTADYWAVARGLPALPDQGAP